MTQILKSGFNRLSGSEKSTASLPDVAKVYAKMSEEAYEVPQARRNKISGFENLKEGPLKELSNQVVALYYLKTKKLYVIAIKGLSISLSNNFNHSPNLPVLSNTYSQFSFKIGSYFEKQIHPARAH